MKQIAITTAAATLALIGTTAVAQTSGGNVRVQPGFFCAQNKCVEFSSDLQSVSIQARVPVSVASYRLARDPVISSAEYNQIFKLALRQGSAGTSR